ncbi:hypothetical protein LBYS11_12215 [Lysinibacillus sp. YS11]|uniref:hypothetical protein n=1 Tax=unclassified Lysinibacillus TaxID=2636778 RepID=UPI0008269F3F|nr:MULTISPECIES: hypothetical protein [unclassified Lysinibacillus]AUS87045.1 hypothetical protein LBYS11_12215 [Lysinibacillus sp. YS11]OCX62714.1 hypothetical protein BFM98_01570 [Lysinibacillus sp. AR18-8]
MINKIMKNILLIFLLLITISVWVYIIHTIDIATSLFYLVIILSLLLAQYIMSKKRIVTKKQFVMLVCQIGLAGIFVPALSLIFVWIITKIWVNFIGLILAMIISFIASIILLFVFTSPMKKSFLDSDLDQNAITNLSAITNFLTFLVTMLLLFYTTFSANESNNYTEYLEKRIQNIESHLIQPNEEAFKPVEDNKNINVDNSAYYYMFIAMIIYVLASYYTLIPMMNRKKKITRNPSQEISVPVNINEKVEIAILLDMKYKHLKYYDKDKQKN